MPRGPERCPCCEGRLGATLHGTDRLHGPAGHFTVRICSTCGAGVTFPWLAVDQLSALYPETYGAHVRGQSLPERLLRPAWDRWSSWLVRRSRPLRGLTSPPSGRLLDVGCGNGVPSAYLVPNGWTVVGVEPDPVACELAAQRGIAARCGTLQSVSLAAERFDAVLFHHSLEHTVDPVADLRLAAGHLRHAGRMLVSVPNFGSRQRHIFGDRWYHLDLPRHRVHFTPRALEAAAARAGLQVTEACTSNSSIGLIGSLEYGLVGRHVLRGATGRALFLGLGATLAPLAWLLGLGGGGDVLHAVLRVPST